jgi:hypothetical protein
MTLISTAVRNARCPETEREEHCAAKQPGPIGSGAWSFQAKGPQMNTKP